MTQQAKQRPFLVTLLAILAGIVGVVAVIHTLQGLGILPFFIGSFKVRNFDLWYALTWGLMAWVYFWLVQMLWRLDRSAWLFLAVIYDGILLLLFMFFEHYPLDRFALVMTLFNPVDLSRVLIMLQLDISALMGYTGAVFRKFLGTATGMAIAYTALTLWIILPVLGFLRLAGRKDF